MIDPPVPVVLASSSDTRRRLLSRLVTDFEVVPPEVDEQSVQTADARAMVLELARRKARQVAGRRPRALVIAADTVAVCCGQVLGKPADRADALAMLRRLTRRPHRVLTGLCVVAPAGRECARCVATRIQMRRLTDGELERLAGREGALERAGAYALRPDDPNVVQLEGSETAVMGLPLEELEGMIRQLYPSE